MTKLNLSDQNSHYWKWKLWSVHMYPQFSQVHNWEILPLFTPSFFFFFWIIRQFQQEILLMNLEFSNIKFRSFLAQNKFKTEMTCLHEGQNIGSFCFPFNCAFFQVSIFQLYYASQLHRAGDTTITGDSTWLFLFSWNESEYFVVKTSNFWMCTPHTLHKLTTSQQIQPHLFM